MSFDNDQPNREQRLVDDHSVPFRVRKGRLADWQEQCVDPLRPTEAEPGTSEKVVTLAARYAAGLPLWHDEDRDGHGPEVIEEDDST